MIFQHTLLDESKTQTSRIVKPGEHYNEDAKYCQCDENPEGLELLGQYGSGSGWVFKQPKEKYQAWVLNFELIK